MKTVRNFMALVLLAGLAACSNPGNNQDETQESEAIHLNDGEKWAVNAEMQAPISKAEERLQYFLDNGEGDYKSLASDLKEYNQKLIESCTMKGESHEELHKWLHPHLDLVKELASVEESAQGQIVLKEIQKSFDTYHKYFQ